MKKTFSSARFQILIFLFVSTGWIYFLFYFFEETPKVTRYEKFSFASSLFLANSIFFLLICLAVSVYEVFNKK